VIRQTHDSLVVERQNSAAEPRRTSTKLEGLIWSTVTSDFLVARFATGCRVTATLVRVLGRCGKSGEIFRKSCHCRLRSNPRMFGAVDTFFTTVTRGTTQCCSRVQTVAPHRARKKPVVRNSKRLANEPDSSDYLRRGQSSQIRTWPWRSYQRW
jgi:hypothetical protein